MLIKSGLTYQEVRPYEFNNELKLIKQVVNGKLQFGDLEGNNKNMYGEMLVVDFPVANTDVAIPYGILGIPVGFITIRNTNGGIIYDGQQAWNNSNIYLRSTTANNRATIFILG